MTKNKFYYGNQLIRTSSHDYKYALLYKMDGEARVIKCSEKREACEQEFRYRTKAEAIGKQIGKTIDEVWYMAKYKLWSSQLYKSEDLMIVELEKR